MGFDDFCFGNTVNEMRVGRVRSHVPPVLKWLIEDDIDNGYNCVVSLTNLCIYLQIKLNSVSMRLSYTGNR